MELLEALLRRRMVRSFQDRAVEPGSLQAILESALRAPSAGFTQGVDLVVLEGRAQTGVFWETTTTSHWRQDGTRAAGLMRAPVVVLPLSNRSAYLRRYSEPDKAGTRLSSAESWPVPYWTVDTAFATMLILLRATDAGLGALFFRILTGEEDLLQALGIPPEARPIGALALGYPDGADAPSASLARGRRPLEEVVHRGRW